MLPKPTTLRAAATRRANRQSSALAATIQAWRALREVEQAGGDVDAAMTALRAALDNLEYEIEKA